MRDGWFVALASWLSVPIAAMAQDFAVHGFVDARVVSASGERAWLDGGVGKARYGDADGGLHFGAAALVATWQFAPEWLAFADVRAQPRNGAALALTEAFLRYRPVSLTPWRWSFKAGEFFAPVSLENDAIAWTSPWTVTSSALDTWVGEELRVFGAEARIEHRGESQSIEAAAAIFAANDPAGEILASRGWSMGDFVAGAGSRLREPDAYAAAIGVAPPRRYDPFLEIDDRIGGYAEVTWRSPQFGRATLLYYDNHADPSAYHGFDHGDELFAWRTKFTSLGAQTGRGAFVLIAQGMAGTTEIAPSGFRGETHFAAGYVLGAAIWGAWRPALRFDAFTTREDPASVPAASEHGTALTLALNWRPIDWLRLTGEALRIDSTRDQRLSAGEPAHRIDTQLLVNARVLF